MSESKTKLRRQRFWRLRHIWWCWFGCKGYDVVLRAPDGTEHRYRMKRVKANDITVTESFEEVK